MKCIECGGLMELEFVKEKDNLYYCPAVCADCGREELQGLKPYTRP